MYDLLMIKRILTFLAALAVICFIGTGAASATNSGNSNDASYWETPTTKCFKHPATGSNEHGSSNGVYVVLNTFNQGWFGDHWALLIVKGGSEGQDGAGNAIYPNPTAGVAYYPPLNNGGQVAAVSHWIVCKGETPNTTTTTIADTTTTTTVADATTTTAAGDTTTTTLAATGTTEAPTTTIAIVPFVFTSDTGTPLAPTQLPRTGFPVGLFLLATCAITGLGVILNTLRKPAKN